MSGQRTSRQQLSIIFFIVLSLISGSVVLAVAKDQRTNKIVEENKKIGTTQWNAPELKKASEIRKPEVLPSNSTADSGGAAQWTDKQLKPHLNIVNLSGSTVPLPELKVRYYFTRDTNQTSAFTSHVAVVGCANLTTRFVPLSNPLNNADYYLEIGFTTGAGNLAANGQTGDLFVRINKIDWSNFTETNDYSYDGTKTRFADWSRVTVYRNNSLVWESSLAIPTLHLRRLSSRRPTSREHGALLRRFNSIA
jgi:hypothetical protein